MSAVESLHHKQFMRQFRPGEYSYKWKSVASNAEFLKGEPIDALIDDVGERGIQKPVLVYDNTVVDGHHRVIAAAVNDQHIPFERTDNPEYKSQVELASSAWHQGKPWMMPSAAPVDKKSVPPRLRQYLGWKS
jgi:hypothetical protein